MSIVLESLERIVDQLAVDHNGVAEKDDHVFQVATCTIHMLHRVLDDVSVINVITAQLLGIVLAGVITTVIAVRLFHQYAHDQALSKLSREANGVAQLYANAVNESYAAQNGKRSTDQRAPTRFVAEQLEQAA